MLGAVIGGVSVLRWLASFDGAIAFEAALLWWTGAGVCLVAARIMLARDAASPPARPVAVLVDAEEPGLPSLQPDRGARGRERPRLTLRVERSAGGVGRLRAELERVAPAEVVVAGTLLAAPDVEPAWRRELVDLLLALPGPVTLAIAGGSRERALGARLSEPPWAAGGWHAKRALDLIVGCALLVLVSPLLGLIALAVKLDSPGPVIFRQPRTGQHGRVFEILKFRTMHAAAADPGGRRLTARDDRRVTRVGAFLRRTSLDELPQLVNVLRGEMSLVGPRPHPLQALAGGRPYGAVVSDIERRLRVPPGITGLAQIGGWRGATETEQDLTERVRLDLEYIENWSIWLDLEILLRTPFASLFSRNAY